MKKLISLIAAIGIALGVAPTFASGDVEEEFIQWNRFVSVGFSQADRENQVFTVSPSSGSDPYAGGDLSSMSQTYPAEGGYRVVKTKHLWQPYVFVNMPNTRLDASVVKMGLRFKSNVQSDDITRILFCGEGYNGDVLASIGISSHPASGADSGGSAKFGKDMGVTPFAQGSASVPTPGSDEEIDVAIIFDMEKGQVTPMVNGKAAVGAYPYSGAMPKWILVPLMWNWSHISPSGGGNAGRYFHFLEAYMEEGLDPTIDCSYKNMTDEHPRRITKDLTLPASPLPSGATVFYESSDTSAIGADGHVTRGEEDKPVLITAHIDYNGEAMEKHFTFVVSASGREEKSLFLLENEYEDSTLYYSFIRDGGKASYTDGYLRLERSGADGELSAQKYFVSELANEPYCVSGDEVVLETCLKLTGGTGMVTVYDERAEKLAELTAVANGEEGYHLTSRYAGGENSAEIPGVWGDVHIRYIFNTNEHTFRVFANNQEIGTECASLTEHGVSSAKIALAGAEGSLDVDYMNLLIRTDDRDKTCAALDAANLTLSDLTMQQAESISSDLLAIPTRRFGSEVSYRSNRTDVIDEMGRVHRQPEDVPVTVTAVLQKGGQKIEKEFHLIVKGMNLADLAINQTTYASAEDEGHSAQNAVDYMWNTSWETSGSAPWLTVGLPESTTLNKAILREAENENGAYGVTGFVLEISDNNRSWTQVAEGTAVGESQTVLFNQQKAKYVRYRVTSKEGAKTGLYELELYYEPLPQDALALDKEEVIVPGEYTVTGDLKLITRCTHGSTVAWTSSHPELISADGKLVGMPAKDTTVTLTAVITNDTYSFTKTFTRLVKGDRSGDGSGSGSKTSAGGRSPVGSLASPGLLGGTGANDPVKDDDPAKPSVFSDVDSSRWSYPYIRELYESGIVSGDGDGRFHPAKTVNREEFVKMLVLALRLEDGNGTANVFSDVVTGAWYEEYLNTALALGVVRGVSDSKFGVGTPISRQDMAVMTLRALEVTGKILPAAGALEFADAQSVAEYAKDAVSRLTAAGVISGADGRFMPAELLSKEQAAKIIAAVRIKSAPDTDEPGQGQRIDEGGKPDEAKGSDGQTSDDEGNGEQNAGNKN